MNRVTPFLVIGSVGLASGAGCIAPMMPGPTKCGECEDLRGNQCVSSGRWYSCYKSITECCDSWDIKAQVPSASCIAASEGSEGGSGPNTGINQVENEYCKKVVSLSDAQTNGDCMDQCDALIKRGKKPEMDADWSSKCAYSHWYAHNGRTVVEGDCFEKWIYGYSQEVGLATIDSNLIVDTPAQCQLHCQLNDECVNWAWVSDLYASTGSERVGRCLLKNKKMVEMALTISTSAFPSPNMDTQYCNYGLPGQCLHGGFRCLPCGGGDPKCVWESDMHISGWKYCTPTDTCSPFTPLPPPLAPTTTVTISAKPTTTTITTTQPTNTTTTATKPTTTTTTTTKPTTTTTTTPEPTTTTSLTIESTAPIVMCTNSSVPPSEPGSTQSEGPATPVPTADTEETYPPVQPPLPGTTTSAPVTFEPVGSGDVVTRPPSLSTDDFVRPSEKPTVPEGSIDATRSLPLKDTTTTGLSLDNTTAESGSGHGEEPTEGGAEECVPPKKPSCHDKCGCHGHPNCACDKGQLYIRISDRPKRLHFDLEN